MCVQSALAPAAQARQMFPVRHDGCAWGRPLPGPLQRPPLPFPLLLDSSAYAGTGVCLPAPCPAPWIPLGLLGPVETPCGNPQPLPQATAAPPPHPHIPISPHPRFPESPHPHVAAGEHPLPGPAPNCAIPAGCFLLKEIPGTGWGRGRASVGCEQQWEGVPVWLVSTQRPALTRCWGLQGWETARHFVSAFVLQVQQSQTHSTHSRKGKAAVKPASAQVLPHPHSTCTWLLHARHPGACRQPLSWLHRASNAASHIWHTTSHVLHPTSGIPRPKCSILCLSSYLSQDQATAPTPVQWCAGWVQAHPLCSSLSTTPPGKNCPPNSTFSRPPPPPTFAIYPLI